MRIFGIDFTSAPRKAKPIVCCSAEYADRRLRILRLEHWDSFQPFEASMRSPGPCFGGIDAPLGQPRQLICDLGWPKSWSDYVAKVRSMSKQEFVQTLEEYSRSRLPGKKHLFRETDRRANACSPMMIYGVPVAKMFYEAVTRLVDLEISIVPCRETADDRAIAESYPALAAREIIGRQRYKASSKSTDSQANRAARKEILQTLRQLSGSRYGLAVRIPSSLQQLCFDDFTGDNIDAVLCCVQAAWAYEQDRSWVPSDIDCNEGWIVGS